MSKINFKILVAINPSMSNKNVFPRSNIKEAFVMIDLITFFFSRNRKTYSAVKTYKLYVVL